MEQIIRTQTNKKVQKIAIYMRMLVFGVAWHEFPVGNSCRAPDRYAGDSSSHLKHRPCDRAKFVTNLTYFLALGLITGNTALYTVWPFVVRGSE